MEYYRSNHQYIQLPTHFQVGKQYSRWVDTEWLSSRSRTFCDVIIKYYYTQETVFQSLRVKLLILWLMESSLQTFRF